MNRGRDIFREPASEFHLVKFGANHHALACLLWHPAGDAVTLAEIVKAFMGRYHELTCGEKPAFSNYPMSVSTGNKRAMRTYKTSLRDYWTTSVQTAIPFRKCSVPAGSGAPGDFTEHYTKRLFTTKETEDLVTRAGKIRVSFVDFLLAAVSLTVDQWNRARSMKTSVVSAALTVNLQGRSENYDDPNNDSVIYFRFDHQQRQDSKAFPRHIFRFRMRKFREGADIKYSKGLAKLNNFLNKFPFHIRQKAYLKILQKHQTSFALGFIGVLWPESNGNRISGDSYLKTAGDLEMIEAYGMAYRIVSSTPLYLTAYFFRKKLNLILSASAWKFTKQEAQEFLDLVVTPCF